MSMFGWRGRRKPAAEDKKGQAAYSTETIVTGDLQSVVMLPDGEDLNEWLAVSLLSFFNNINMYYSVVSELCTAQTCPSMTANKTEYQWTDDRGRRTKVPAPQYVDIVTTYIQKQLTDENVFPTKFGSQFPKDFQAIVRKIFKFLFQVLAHIYHAHSHQVVALGLEAHINTLLIHFILFAQKFKLLEASELAPLQDLIKQLAVF
ncbi:HCCA2 protein [Capsaspora owczarzaki ATCC 30864]|uniref:HCCA2 protein n=1 Tax=Capsaspora owczarzaki (strain ATCC 30864) TaxID=595528 RepID=UPI00035264B7|nr:HCCA2 protein [Capsaspora owczarzaki ATCC 30864]|eukprot:XP_004343608.2 HCCA2 protein [Capsaspora owczarzaki ATCC 30864]